MRRLLVLRPEPGASATVDKAQKMGLDAVAAPLFVVEPLAWRGPDPAQFDGLLLTSANAIRHGGGDLAAYRKLPVYAVGEATAAAARDAGFTVANTGDSDIDRLLSSIEPGLRLLHLCGADRREPNAATQSIHPVAVYCAAPVPAPALPATRGMVALIHSPRAGHRFAELAMDRSTIAIAAISEAAASAVGDGWQSVAAAGQPSDESLLALAARLCNKPALQ
jgi:uroporphyrinogen-III synthase